MDTNHEILEKGLTDAGFICDYFAELDPDGLGSIIGNYSGIIVRSRFQLDKSLLEKADNLSFIGRVGAGMEGIDVAYYLIHSMGDSDKFAERDRQAAENFATAATNAARSPSQSRTKNHIVQALSKIVLIIVPLTAASRLKGNTR